ncbi:DUF3891 family protein [Flavimarina sp. Hel_I_48]|uniref:DUF3891 family protein n=1 Tax=Flavimarina sp. Hel_I_48 TaxID=1392488 RepID=UPI0004DF60CC|nr:DUF3891 family protein [Flavimarina sp. Hel_I_48]
MIATHLLTGWEIVSHYTHGLLAGKIAMQLSQNLRSDYWGDILTAIIEHDDHLQDFSEKNYLTDVGTPLDFTLDKRSEKDAHEHALRVYANSCQKSQLVALLVGRHLEFLFDTGETLTKDFKAFFKMLKTERKAQLKLYGWSTSDLENTYKLMRFCDRCSLIICQHLIPQGGRQIEINKTIDNKTYFIKEIGEKLHIDPWPFEKDSFKISYEYRILEQSGFINNKELQNSIQNAPVKIREINFTMKNPVGRKKEN